MELTDLIERIWRINNSILISLTEVDWDKCDNELSEAWTDLGDLDSFLAGFMGSALTEEKIIYLRKVFPDLINDALQNIEMLSKIDFTQFSKGSFFLKQSTQTIADGLESLKELKTKIRSF